MPRLPTSADFPSSLTLSIVPQPPSHHPVNVLILLHGLGDTHASFTRLASQLQLPETAYLSLRGFAPIPPFFTGSETPAFHWGDDILFDEGKGEIELDTGFAKGLEVLKRDVVDVLLEKCEFKERNILFLGYGQGAMLALALAASLPPDKEFGGVVSIGGKLPASVKNADAKARTPVLVCGGSRSTQVTRSAVDNLKAVFKDLEYVKWEKTEDSMPKNRDEMLPLMKFFARRLRSRAGVPEGAVEI